MQSRVASRFSGLFAKAAAAVPGVGRLASSTTPAAAGASASLPFPQARAAHPRADASDYVVTAPHMRVTKNTEEDYTLSHAVYTREECAAVQVTHYEPRTISDKVALNALLLVRKSFDFASGYGHNMTADKYLTRVVFLETVAGVPVSKEAAEGAPASAGDVSACAA
jgi:hypothetical protein